MRIGLLAGLLLAASAGCNEETDGFGRMKPQAPAKPPVLKPVVAPKPLDPYKVQSVNAPKPVQAFEVKTAGGPQPVQPHKGQPTQATPYDPQKQKAPVIRPDPKLAAAQQLLKQKQ